MTIKELHKLFSKSEGIATDTRKIKKNTLFFALKGENFNGNDYAREAIEKGASYAIVDEIQQQTSKQIILVDNVLTTLQKLAKYHRKKLNTTVIALTGSNGKTTSKELINVVLSKKFTTTATIGNLNNHIGVPLTLLSMDHLTKIGIVEMGANHLKEIELLTSIAAPDYGYITNFGKAHLEGFGNFKNIIKGKTELYDYLYKNNGKAFVNITDSIQKERSKHLQTILFGEETQLKQADPFVEVSYQNCSIKTKLVGSYNFNNINAAIAIGNYFGLEKEAIKEAIEDYNPSNNRSQMLTKGDSKILLDAYNANPSSMKAALKNFKNVNAVHKTVILGDMFELGETSIHEHQIIADLATSLDFNTVFLIGENFSKTKNEKAIYHMSFENFQKSFKKQKNTCFLIKGSRGMSLERVLELL